MNTEAYLNRLRYSGALEPTLTTLKALQKHHLVNIPFENLDIHYGTPIELDINKLYNKIILNHRGGFCYELNGLFYAFLIDLGFKAARVSARVWDKQNGYSQEFDHMAILVEAENETYLTDVGFGEFTFAPLKLTTEMIQHDERGYFVIDEDVLDDVRYFRVNKIENSARTPQYVFTTVARELEAYQAMCLYHQTSPGSHFTQQRICSLATNSGRITLTGRTLKSTSDGIVTTTELPDEQAVQSVLKKLFNIEI